MGDDLIMRKRSFHIAVTAAVFCASAFLLACPLGQLRILIPDFFTNRVEGVQLYRIDDVTGALVEAGHIEFIELDIKKAGIEQLKYKQFTAEGEPWFGPLYTDVVRDPSKPASLEVTLAFLNQLPAGWFKVASFNVYGTSRASTSQTFISAEESG
jgi:hypothetical protein